MKVQEIINSNPALITNKNYYETYFKNTIDGIVKTKINKVQEEVYGIFVREYTNNIIDIYV